MGRRHLSLVLATAGALASGAAGAPGRRPLAGCTLVAVPRPGLQARYPTRAVAQSF